LIAPYIKNGLTIRLTGTITSRPYINMTLKMMERLNVQTSFERDHLSVVPQQYSGKNLADNCYETEADWSAASYWYAMAALAETVDITLAGLKQNSMQGDFIIADLFTFFGIKTEFTNEGVRLTKLEKTAKKMAFEFSDCPDVAQTVAVIASALKIPCLLNGLHTLKIKETDRIQSLINELSKLKVTATEINNNSLEITDFGAVPSSPVSISTYDDHRMAMAFAPLALIYDGIKIENPEVVKKSYPNFWEDMKSVGFEITSA
jgi:3-phosphoshikimate 1-carboxyvinyltransferase